MTVFRVPSVMEKIDHKANLKSFDERIFDATVSAARSRTHKSWKLSEMYRLISEANEYAIFFGLKTRFAAPTKINVESILAEAERRKKADEAANRRQYKKADKIRAEKIERWKAGENILIPPITVRPEGPWNPTEKVYLRINGDVIQTTKHAEVPVDHAKKLLPFIRSGKPYEHNGHSLRVGQFTVSKIDEHGNLWAGCHYIEREEIERIAAQLGE